jgi:hypothetical protein
MNQPPEPSAWLSATLAAIVRVILPPHPELDAADRNTVEVEVTRYVARQIQSMPGFLRVPYRAALLAFDLLPLLRYARPFRALAPAGQAAYLAQWNEAPIAAMRDVIKLMRSSALLVYYDHPLVIARLEAARPSDDIGAGLPSARSGEAR